MTSSKDMCGVCSWRENCRKKSAVAGRHIRCPDFVRDLRAESPAASSGNGDKVERP